MMQSEDTPDPEHEQAMEFIRACYRCIETDNVDALVPLIREHGCPPHLRYRVWPMLLKKHPFVAHPYIEPNYASDVDSTHVPIRDIRSDLRRYFRKNLRQHGPGADVPRAENEPYSPLLLVEQRIFKTLEYSIVRFLRKWGRLFKYEAGLAWIALGLAEWYPPLHNNKHYVEYAGSPALKYVLVGKDMSLGRFERMYRRGLSRPVEEKDDSSQSASLPDSDDAASTVSTSGTSTASSGRLFLEDPDLCESSCVIGLETEFNVHYDNFLENNADFEAFERQMIQVDASVPLRHRLLFPEVFERLVLVILHVPEEERKAGESPVSLASSGGTVDERLSFFHYLLRTQLNDVSSFFREEGVLSLTLNLTGTGDDWLLWWIRWSGARAFRKGDRGRLWDLLIGWRPDPCVLTCFSAVDPHVQLVFVYLAFLKSQENLIFELDQTEIRQVLSNGLVGPQLNRVSKKRVAKSLKSNHKSYVTYESVGTSPVLSPQPNEKQVASLRRVDGGGERENNEFREENELLSPILAYDDRYKALPLVVDKSGGDIEDVLGRSKKLWLDWLKNVESEEQTKEDGPVDDLRLTARVDRKAQGVKV